MAIFRGDHVHLKASDVAATSQWYCDVLGGEFTFEGQFRGSAVRFVELPGLRIYVYGELENELSLPASIQPRFGLDHFGLLVDDMDEAIAELRAKGVPILEEPWTVRPGLRIAYIEAPDQVRIELTERAPIAGS